MSNSMKGIITENIDVNSYIQEYVQELKYKDVVVDSLERALELTQIYKSSGKYDWFRGQSRIWPLISSANRLNDKERDDAEERLNRLDKWAHISCISTDPDYVEAIAQHYKMPTSFIDFTTDPNVAAYFASQKPGDEQHEYSCIYCLNTDDFNESIEDIKKYFPNLPSYPKLLDIDVHNLWRLEAQQGKFMYQPCLNLDFFYSLHRIIFKVKENDIQLFDKSYIYPEAKSALEERLDGFFLNERTGKNLKHLYSLMNKLKESGMHIDIFETDNTLYIKEFVNEKILLDYKWNQKDIKLWENKTIEKFEEIYTTEKIIFEINSFRDVDRNKTIVYNKLINFLNTHKEIRKKAISFSIQDNESNSELIKKFEKYSNIIWNGMRKLPYDDEEVVEVISQIMVIIEMSIFKYEKSDEKLLKIGINDGVGGFNNAFVNKDLLFQAMRDDVDDIKVDKTRDVRSIIYHIRSPQLIYKFESLKKLFVKSIIISQVIYGENNFVIFSPCELQMLGLP